MPCDLTGTYDLTGKTFDPNLPGRVVDPSVLVLKKIEGNTYNYLQKFPVGSGHTNFIGVGTISPEDNDVFIFSITHPDGVNNQLVYIEVKKCKKDKAVKLSITKLHTTGLGNVTLLTGLRQNKGKEN